MKNKIKIGILALFLANYATAQNSELLNFEWEDDPKIHTLTEEEAKLPAVYLLHEIANEIIYLEEGSAVEYVMEHVIMHLNTDEAVEDNNKVYMDGSKADPSLYTIIEQARVIKKNGDIITTDAEDVLEETNEEENTTLRYYALEGVEAGDEIEYYYIYPKSPRTNGVVVRMQSDVFKRKAVVTNINPKNLNNAFMSLNGFPEMEQNEDFEDINYFSATAENLQPLREEKFAAYHANRGGIMFHLKSNSYNNTTTDFYNDVSKYIAQQFNEVDPKKDGILKYMKKMEIPEEDDEAKIRYVENYVKKDVRYIEYGIEGLSNLKQITSKRLAGDRGFMLLIGSILNQLDIPFEVVYTCDRNKLAFDEEFESGAFISELLLYFPKEKKYLAPVGLSTRYGFPPDEYTDTYGYFTRFVNVGGINAGIGKIKKIKAVPAEETVDEFQVELFLDELPESRTKYTRKLSGYSALFYQTILPLVEEDSRVEMEEELVNYIDEDMDIESIEVNNVTAEDVGYKPVEVSAEFVSEIFVQKAGNKYLINIGQMIGPQSELYQENERQLPVSNRFNRTYKRTLIVHLPEGYKFGNLDDLNIDVQYDKEGEKDMGFISTYKLEGDKLIVQCDEYYKTIAYPVDEYGNFEKVINAAADFNKVKIVLEKN